jgi:hypothetical protein
MLKHWSSYQRALVLTGTSGTGTSWFQAYALRRLAQEDSTYKFVVRQVKNSFFLHDLTTLNVYKIEYKDEDSLETVVNGMTETIYFYEPGTGNEGSPVYYTIPSLSTLSPNPVRIKEYIKKTTTKKLFFPVWREGDYGAVGLKQGLKQDDIDDRYYMFGGILRHLFHDEYHLQRELEAHLGRGRLEQVLKSVVNDTVSGYLVCYTDIPYDGDQAFESRELMATSSYVKDKIRESTKLVPIDEKARKVLEVLQGMT